MPRQRSVKSLRGQCLGLVARVVRDNHPPPWIQSPPVTPPKMTPRNLSVFGGLPSDLLSDLMGALRALGPLGDQEVKYFLHPQLLQLDLSLNRLLTFPLQLIADRCMNMRKLVLCWNANLNFKALHITINKMHNLVTLNVAGTGCSDQTLHTISISCTKIRDLDVSDCPKVTEHGMMYLCTGGHLGEGKKNVIPCPHIVRINIVGCRVNNKGVTTALSRLPNLQYLEHEWVWQILCQLHKTFQPGKDDLVIEESKKYKLRKIQFSGGYFPADVMRALQVINTFCPAIIDVIVSGCGFDDQCLFRLSQLAPLKSLKLTGKNNMVTFRRGLQHFLKARGELMEALCLLEIPDVNLGCIADFCPKLESLTLLYMQSLHATGACEDSVFKNLLRIEIRVSGADVTEEALEFLLASCPAIQTIILSDVESLTDSLMRTVLKKNAFKKLEHISLWRCNYISKDAILDLLHTADLISSLHIKDCLRVLQTAAITRYVKENFCDVDIIVSPER